MAYQLERLKTPDGRAMLTAEQLRSRIEQLATSQRVRFSRLWGYYRNEMRSYAAGEGGSERPYRQAQEWGMPSRITSYRSTPGLLASQRVSGVARKEVVIENDIGWRIDTMVDYLFGKPVVITSAASDERRRGVLDHLVRNILEQNGGLLFLQQLALLGAIYGHVDVLVKLDVGPLIDHVLKETGTGEAGAGASAQPHEAAQAVEHATPPSESTALAEKGASGRGSPEALIQRIARMIRLEIVEPARALPVLSPMDYRVVDAYVQAYEIEKPEAARAAASKRRWWERIWRIVDDLATVYRRDSVLVTEIVTARRWQRYEDEVLVAEGENSLGEVPLVHIQNTSVPFEYSGASDVEGLIPLQDELNTRLSDRANRIALQSFKMYLGKGIENFGQLAVAPGRMWTTENDNAQVQEFGGDASCPSETQHIADLREAIDKASGVSPIAAGAIKNRIGRLTSAAALRVTLMSLLSRTEKKRTTYGQGLLRMIELALAWLDRAGVFATTADERRFELHWPSPLPENVLEKLQEAEAKARLGVPREVVLRELGY